MIYCASCQFLPTGLKWIIDTFCMGGNLFIIKCDFAFVRLASLKSDIKLK